MACEWIGWCALDAAAQAAWLQALGSLAAIGVAIYVPGKQRRREITAAHAATMARARALALVYLPLFRQWHDSIEGALMRFGEANGEPEWSDWSSIISMLDVTSIDKELMNQSHHFAHASSTVQSFLYHALLAGFAADQARSSDEHGKHAEAFHQHATAASRSLSAAIVELESIASGGAPNSYRRPR